MADEVKRKIMGWLQKSGYPLELFTYQILTKRGFRSVKSPIFEDLDSSQPREIDLHANISSASENYSFSLELIVECKKSDKPLVILCTETESVQRFMQTLGSRESYAHSLSIWPIFQILSTIFR